ncbi:GNAT family N-acetyltransferase [Acinetobacter sp. ANC 3882]|uniref:GNAT family N-acetyltransferase n=1 Tax=Acinetobacter sp. ANC 3882 TaxID=2923423 RepID=UPI001F4B467A|nr:GNAT family N-acetyltransferase [Acinetobacter sp. ANC 3882]MCH7312950.1 GNAT family N-acetyltransferase [Acinetobacter sp. ANC 3882]
MRTERIDYLPPALDGLIECSEREGFQFLNRLKQDFQTGKNCFDRFGEALFVVYLQNQLIAVGGLNQDPFDHLNKVGRLRRFYIHPDYRRKRIGTYLLLHVERYAQAHFERLHLFTDTENAAYFYQSMGYEPLVSLHSNFRKIFE